MPRPPVKATLRLAEAQETGILRAQLKAHKNKPFSEELREHIGKAVDRIDPIEAAAVLAATVIIHTTIVNVEKLHSRIRQNLQSGKTIGGSGLRLFPWIASLFGDQPKTVETTPTNNLQSIFQTLGEDEIFLWLVSFVIAYIGIKNAGKIGSTIADIAGMLGVLGL